MERKWVWRNFILEMEPGPKKETDRSDVNDKAGKGEGKGGEE